MRYILALLLFLAGNVLASEENDFIYQASVEKPMDQVYDNVYKALEEARFYVIFEANIGKNLARNAKRWGNEYNKNKFEAVKTMVICNPYYANQVLNRDPKLMALCPLGVTVLHKQGITTIYFERMTIHAANSPVEDMLWEVENTIISAIESGMNQ